MSRRSRLTAVGVLCAAATMFAAACGATTDRPEGQDGGGGGTECTPGEPTEVPDPEPFAAEVSPDGELAGLVPANFSADGKLVVATDAAYAPNEYTLEGSDEIIGMDIDLLRAAAGVLDLEVEYVNSPFDGILAGLQAGRYELGISSFTDTKEREQVVDFVTYFEAGTSTMVRKCNPEGIETVEDLCGKTVGAQNGTTQFDQLTDPNVEGSVVKACTDAGQEPPNAQGFPLQTDVNAALQAGRIQAYLADTPVVNYAVQKTGNAFEKAGEDADAAPYGIAVPKGAGTMTQALQGAIQKLIDDGTYQEILDNWGSGDGAIEESQINGAIY